MFTSRYYNARSFAARYFPKVGAGAPVISNRPGRATAGQRSTSAAIAQRSPGSLAGQRAAGTEAGEE